jgi:PAS domain S-box-containing protein
MFAMQQSDTIHLLVSCESQAQLEAYVGIFREAGRPTRAHRVTSMKDLGDMLREQQWDLLIAAENHPEVSPDNALKALQEAGSDIPCIVRTPGGSHGTVLQYLKQGARDVIGADDHEHLLLAATREIAATREHRELEELRVQYEETARRCELLLASAQDAIAYVVEGIHVDANGIYAELFGYESPDELTAIPLIDLISPANQSEFKEALRRYRDKPEEQTAIDFTALRHDGSEFPARLVLSTASFEGEPCMQVLVRALAIAPGAAAPGTVGGIDALRSLVAESARGHLVLIHLDAFAQHCRNLGVTVASHLVDEISTFLAETNKWPRAPIRVTDDVIAVHLPEADTERVAQQGRDCVEQVADHIPELGEQSVNCSVCVAVCPLESHGETSVDALLDRSWSTLLDLVDRSESLRGRDPARAQVMSAGESAPEPVLGEGSELLEQEIEKGLFRILFQPIVSLRGHSAEYYEVHVMHVGDKKKLSPARDWLVENASENAVELDHWVIVESLKKLAEHRAKHPNTRLILPVGAGSIQDADFPTWFAVALRAAELPGDSVVIQVSHRAARSYLKRAKQLAERVHDLGAQFSVSEVHSANNPIDDLTHLKPQFARIDEAMVVALEDGESTNTLLKPLVEALHHEQMSSIMPAVQGAGVLAVLWQLGVSFIQGDYLQGPSREMTYDFTDIT